MSCQCQSLGSTAPTQTDLEFWGRLGLGWSLVRAVGVFGVSYLIDSYLFKHDKETSLIVGGVLSGMSVARYQGARAEYIRHASNPLR